MGYIIDLIDFQSPVYETLQEAEDVAIAIGFAKRDAKGRLFIPDYVNEHISIGITHDDGAFILDDADDDGEVQS